MTTSNGEEVGRGQFLPEDSSGTGKVIQMLCVIWVGKLFKCYVSFGEKVRARSGHDMKKNLN